MPPENDGDGDEPADDDVDGCGEEGMESEPEDESDPVVDLPEVEPAQDICFHEIETSRCNFEIKLEVCNQIVWKLQLPMGTTS